MALEFRQKDLTLPVQIPYSTPAKVKFSTP